MAKHKMTDRWVSALKPLGSRVEIGDSLAPGLILRASASGVKAWSAVIRVGDRVQRVSIGRYPAVPLAGAREETLRLQRLAAQGGDLRAEAAAAKRAAVRAAAEDVVTFGQVMDAYIEHVTRTARSWKNIASMLRRPELQLFHPRAVTDVTKRELITAIDGVAAAGSPHGASNTLRYLQTAYRFGVERDLIQHNPIERVRAPAPIVSRDRVLSPSELRRVWHAAGTMAPQWTAMIRMMILTGQRRTEVGRMRWEDVEGETWTIPRERTKKDRAQHVHLTPAALKLLAALPRPANGTGFVFSGDGGVTASSYFSAAKTAVDQAAELNEPWRFHDLRRTVRSGLAELGVPEPVSRKIMNHASAGVDGVYNRYSYAEEAKQAWGDWAAHVLSIIR
jgi:integrase